MNLIQPTPEQQTLLQKLNHEETITKLRDIETIKQWLKQEPHLPDTFDDHALLNFLRWAKFSLEKAKKRIDMFFTVKNAFPEFFTDRDITSPELQRIHEIWSLAALPVLTPEARRITVATYRGLEFHAEDTINFAKVILMMGDVRIGLEGSNQDIYVVDAALIQWKNVPNVSIVAVKKFLICALEAYPVRVKEFHVINASPLVGLVVKWAARFVKDKIMKRVQLHDSLESLHKCVPKEFLPEEVGGTAGKLEEFTKQWAGTLKEWKGWFQEQEKVKADESMRVDKDVFCGGVFGVDGSFRQLAID